MRRGLIMHNTWEELGHGPGQAGSLPPRQAQSVALSQVPALVSATVLSVTAQSQSLPGSARMECLASPT